MSREDVEKLLGGYATNSLTDQERQKLFEAALGDQTLFNALVDEQALKEVLDEPRSRRLLIEALRERQARLSGIERLRAWAKSWAGSTDISSPLPQQILQHRATTPVAGGSARLWRRPSTWALAGSVAVALLAITLIRLTGPLPDAPMTTASKAPLPSISPAIPPESKPVPQASEADKAPAPSLNSENRTSQPLTRAPAPRLPEVMDETSSALGKKDLRLPPAPPSVADEEQGPGSSGALTKQEQQFRTTTEEAVAPPPRITESPLSQSAPQPQQQMTQDKLQGKALEQRTFGAPGEQMRRLSPMASSAPRTEEKHLASGVRYTVLQEGKDGSYSEVDSETTFNSSDKARLRIEPYESGYLYVLVWDAAGNSKLIFPPAGTGVSARVEKTVRYLVPPGGAVTFQDPGDVRLTIILAPEELDNIQHLPGLFAVMKKRKTSDPEEFVGGESADVPVTAKPPARARLESRSIFSKQDLTLKHR